MLNAQIRIYCEICTSDAFDVWVTCAGYRELVRFKGKDKAKRAEAWAARVNGVRTLADHLRNVAAADGEAGSQSSRLSPSFFGIMGEEAIRLEAIALATLSERGRENLEHTLRLAADGVWDAPPAREGVASHSWTQDSGGSCCRAAPVPRTVRAKIVVATPARFSYLAGAMKKPVASVYLITSDNLCAYVNVGSLQICFIRTADASPGDFRASSVNSTEGYEEILLANVPAADQEAAANALRIELATRAKVASRKLTFAQVQRIYGRAVD